MTRPAPTLSTDDARCRAEPELFFPLGEDTEAGPQGPARDQVEQARALCRACQLLRPCLRYALDHPELKGIRAGTTTRERAAARRATRIA